YIFLLFFFSSRRRHTRCYRDWSSDVCSSDLSLFPQPYHRSLGKVGETESMPKILTIRRREDERERARLYLKSRLMLPTIPLGMVTLLAGYGDMVLMWIQNELTPQALLGSTILFLCGAFWGW